MIASLGAAVAYRLRLWNLGLDGQMVMGGWCGLAVGLVWPHLGGYLLVPLMLVAGVLGGALWIAIPALARALLGVSEVLTTFLLTFVAMAWMSYWVTGPWLAPVSSGSVNQSKPIPVQSQLGLIDIDGVVVHWGIFIPVGLAAGLWLTWHFTRSGYRLTVVGASERTAHYAGLSVRRTVITVLLVSGAFGGLAGVVEMLGDLHYLGDGLTSNTGFEAIVVAVLAGGSFPGVALVSLLYATLIVGGNAVTIDGVAPEVVLSMLGLTLLFASIGEAWARLRLVRRSRRAVDQPVETRVTETVST
jgi:simple sugar transport system permease protein